jgi:hypothetical protein
MKTSIKRTRELKVYLSGGMEYAQNEGADWRNDLEEWFRNTLGHDVFNPNRESARYLAPRIHGVDFRMLKTRNVRRFVELVAGIVDLDSREIAERSDYVVCYWDHSAQRGAGTKGELTIARYFHKPVYMVTETNPDNIPGWILGCTDRMFGSFEELKKFLRKKFKVRASKEDQ